MGVLRVSEELQLNLELERFRAVIEAELNDTENVERLVAGWSPVVGEPLPHVFLGDLPLRSLGSSPPPSLRDARHREEYRGCRAFCVALLWWERALARLSLL